MNPILTPCRLFGLCLSWIGNKKPITVQSLNVTQITPTLVASHRRIASFRTILSQEGKEMKKTFPMYDASRRYAFPRRIAVATNLADREMLLPYAISEARATGAHLCLIHALDAYEVRQGVGWLGRIGDRN